MAIEESVVSQHARGILRFTSEAAIAQNLAAAAEPRERSTRAPIGN